MSEHHDRVSRLDQIAIPPQEVVVELSHLRQADGALMRIRCHRLSALQAWTITQALQQAMAAEQDAAGGSRVRWETVVAAVEAGASLVDSDGKEVRPAICFSNHPEGACSLLDGNLLSMSDLLALFAAIMGLSGYAPAEGGALSFPGE